MSYRDFQNNSLQPSQIEMVMHWNANTAHAARKPKIESTVVRVSEPASSSSSAWMVAICVAETEPVIIGCVGGANCTVAFGSATVLPGSGGVIGFVAGPARPGIGPAVFSGTVGAPVEVPVLSLMVGAAAGRAMGPAVLRGIVGAGAGALLVAVGTLGAGTVAIGAVAIGGRVMPTVGVGGLGATGGAGGAIGAVGGATGVTAAEGDAGASLAFNVTRTVSFLRGMLEVCLDGVFWSSLMGLMVCEVEETQKRP